MSNIVVNVGKLQSIPSVYFSTSKGLSQFSSLWAQGHRPSVTWDLTGLVSGHVNVGAVSFFLAIAHRVKLFSGRPQVIKLDWHPKIFTFLSDIEFFDVANEYDLFEWPYDIGGFDESTLNPNTRILSFDQLVTPPPYQETTSISEWKKLHREKYRQYIVEKCESLFTVHDSFHERELPLIMSRTCSELATNSLLWGDATAFLGLQRTSGQITISISDIGRGFKYSLATKNLFKGYSFELDDINSIALGSIINEHDFGLKRAISTVISMGGTISITSSHGEIKWGKGLWNYFLNNIEVHGVNTAINSLPSPISKPEPTERYNGYTRNWSNSIRGTRIEFYIPLSGE